jgi:hypothetical protein
VVRARDGARPHLCNIIINNVAAAAEQQQQQPALENVAPPPAPLCPICKGPHAEQLPCFVQPRMYERQCQLEALERGEEEEEEIPQLVPFNEEVSGDDDDAPNILEEEEEGNELAPPPMLLPEDGEHRQPRKPLRFLWWDVESEVVMRQQNVRKHVPILICAEVLCEK